MAVKHTKVATVADDGTSEVGTNEWNDDHTIDNNTITDAMISSHTTTKITVPTTQLSGTVTNAQLTGSIANTKLATDPLARANHTGSQAQSTITDLTTDLSSKSPLASPTFTGTVTTAAVDVAGNNIDNIQNLIHDISATGLDIDFSEDQLQTYPTLTGNVTFTTFQNIVAGKSKTIRLLADSTDRECTFPSGIKWVGTAPTSNVHTVTASKYAIITFTSFGTTEAEIIGAFAVEE